MINITNTANVQYELQSFYYGDTGPSDYQVITNNIIIPGQKIFGAIVVSSSTLVVVTVNGTPTTINIPSGDVIFYCFTVKTAEPLDVQITLG